MGRTAKKIPREKKLIITFDEEARKDYLTGFSKRKRLRKKRARAEELKNEQAKKKDKRTEKKLKLKQTMMRYNLLDTKSRDDKTLPSNTRTEHYSDTTVIISDIPALEARISNNGSISVEDSADSQLTSTTSSKDMSSSKKSLQPCKLRNKSQKKLRKLKKWNCT